jgi:hypothetical protein
MAYLILLPFEMKKPLTSTRFNFLLTPEQKHWLTKKAGNFTSCGDILRNLIQEAMENDSGDDKSS